VDSSSRTEGNVLLLSDVTGQGGVSTHLVWLARFAQSRGWFVSVLLDDCASVNGTAAKLSRIGVTVVRGPLYHGYHTEQTIRNFVSFVLKEIQPEVVHAHCGSPRSALFPRELVIDTGLPLIVTEHYVPPDLAITEDQYSRLKAVYSQSAFVVSVCEENRRMLRERHGLWSERHVVIRYGVAIPASHRRTEHDGRFRAITVARFVPQKGIDVLLKAIAHLTPNVRENMAFTVIGGGPLEGALRNLASELGIAERIEFLEWVENVADRLWNYDLFILPSRSEGLPIALLEALSIGLPCIASSVSGIPEALADGRYGRLIPADDPVSLATAIESFVSTPNELSTKAIDALGHLEKWHNLEANLGKVVSLWELAARQRYPG
jgi:glycosyltransferase involved in cell wall biosynthesis